MVLRVVIDSNRLQSDELRTFLSVSQDNHAVLTEYAWMEAYKGNSLVSIQRSMSVLKDFPDQVIVLKGARAIATLDPRAPGLARRMYWSRAGREFHEMVDGLRHAEKGHERAIRQIIEHGKSADRHMDKILADMTELPTAFSEMMLGFFTKSEIADLRSGMPHSATIVRKFFMISEELALRFYKKHPRKPRRPTNRSKLDAFIYRVSIAHLLYFLSWIREGSQLKKAPAKLRNDTIDISFATYGTYFNGVMSDDKRVNDLHIELRVILETAGIRMPPEYLPEFIKQLG